MIKEAEDKDPLVFIFKIHLILNVPDINKCEENDKLL